MSKKIHVCAGLALSSVLSLSAPPAHAKPPAKAHRAATQLASASAVLPNAETGFEKSLLGVRILQSYKVALAKLGQPSRIFRADEQLEVIYDLDAKGQATGGVNDIVSKGDIQKDTSASSGGDTPPPNPDGSDPSADPTAADPNAAGMPPQGAGLNGSAQEKPPETFGQSGGFRWAYFNKAEKRAYYLSFNRDGRLMEIAELGLGLGGPTRRNINLGAPLNEVYKKYGWPDSVQETKEGIQLFYDIKHHCQFDIVNNKVTCIAVFLAEGMKLRILKSDSSGGGGGNSGGGGSNGAAPPPRRASPGRGGNG